MERYRSGRCSTCSRADDWEPGLDNEASIIEAARGGDSAAFEQLLKRYSIVVFRYVRNIVGDRHDAEDVAQRVWLNLHRNLDRFDPNRGTFSTWVYRIARNAALNHLRDHKRSPIRFDTPVPPASGELPPPSQAVLREQFALLDEAVAALPDHQRAAWVLSELEGLTQAEIARIEGVPEGTVKSRVSRARESLRNLLSNQLGLER